MYGCATTPKKYCPSISEEPISICRAKQACAHGGTKLGIFLTGVGGGDGVTPYNRCVERDLIVQEANYRLINKE